MLYNFLLEKNIKTLKLPADLEIPVLQAHRGYWQQGSMENTLGAFSDAVKKGYQGFECDVQLSKDLIPMIYHDTTLSRLHSQNRHIQDCTSFELKSMGINSLSEVLSSEQVPDFINIEIKSVAWANFTLERKVVEVIQTYGSGKKIIISSFNPLSLGIVALLDSSIPRALLVPVATEFAKYKPWSRRALFFFAKAHLLHVDYKSLTVSEVQDLATRGLNIALWTLNEQTPAKEYLQAGALSIITDKVLPDDLR